MQTLPLTQNLICSIGKSDLWSSVEATDQFAAHGLQHCQQYTCSVNINWTLMVGIITANGYRKILAVIR